MHSKPNDRIQPNIPALAEDEYGRIARVYDPIINPFLDGVRRRICRLARSLGSARILDVCCGTGRQVIMFHEFGLEAVGVDMSPAMLHVARRKSPNGIVYFLEDASDMHFQADSFDLALISLSLHEKAPPVRRAIIRESRRVLKPGGHLIVFDYSRPVRPLQQWGIAIACIAERMGGARHFRLFRQYLRTGGTEGLLADLNLEFKLLDRRHFDTLGLFLVSGY